MSGAGTGAPNAFNPVGRTRKNGSHDSASFGGSATLSSSPSSTGSLGLSGTGISMAALGVDGTGSLIRPFFGLSHSSTRMLSVETSTSLGLQSSDTRTFSPRLARISPRSPL